MTKSVTIVNSSNWKNEDLEITVEYDDREPISYVLKPCDQKEITYYYKLKNIKVKDLNPENKNISPMKDKDGVQVFPDVNVSFKKVGTCYIIQKED